MSDEQLITSSFALAYPGAVIDMQRTGKGIGETISRLEWDKASIEDSRRTAVEWQLSSSIEETATLSAAGFEKAISLSNEHRELIQHLADGLIVKISLDDKELADWYMAALSKETE